MTPYATEGFIAGYRTKEANAFGTYIGGVFAALSGGGVGAAANLTAEGIKAVIPWLVLLPVAAGAGAGLMHSKMTSPASLDIQGVQKSLELSELEEFATELTRRREAATRRGKKEKSDARTLRL